ncbi:hypothetical protein GQ42DRAFT_176684 [Ramicandelaber brevisporus]|nr:hypothetical protein GQ42DRAFT_176684 [Ramicandelaber brevisporus]
MSTTPRTNGLYIPLPQQSGIADQSILSPVLFSPRYRIGDTIGNHEADGEGEGEGEGTGGSPAESVTVAVDEPQQGTQQLGGTSDYGSLCAAYIAIVTVVTNHLEPPKLKSNFASRVNKGRGHFLLSETSTASLIREFGLSMAVDSKEMQDAIVRLTIEAVTTGLSSNWRGRRPISAETFYKKVTELSNMLAIGKRLLNEDYVVAIRLATITHAARAHLAALLGIIVKVNSNSVNFFGPATLMTMLIANLARTMLKENHSDILISILLGSKHDLQRLLPVIEADTGMGLVPRETTRCVMCSGADEGWELCTRDGLCSFQLAELQHDMANQVINGYWVTAYGIQGPKVVFRNLDCPGDDSCPINCNRIQCALSYEKHDSNSNSNSDSDSNNKDNLIHKLLNSINSLRNSTNNNSNNRTVHMHPPLKTALNDDSKLVSYTDEYMEASKLQVDDKNLMVPSNFIENLTSRGVFGLKGQPLVIILYVVEVGLVAIAITLAVGAIKVKMNDDTSTSISTNTNTNGNFGNIDSIVISGNGLINNIISSISQLGNAAAVTVALTVAGFLPPIVSKFFTPYTKIRELATCRTAVTSFSETCKVGKNCPGCMTAAMFHERVSVSSVAYGKFAGLVGNDGTTPLTLRACFDLPGTTTCLHRAGYYFIHAFKALKRSDDTLVKLSIGPHQFDLPQDIPGTFRNGHNYFAQKGKAFIARTMTNKRRVAIVASVDITPNRHGKITWLDEAFIVEPLSTPICDVKYLF